MVDKKEQMKSDYGVRYDRCKVEIKHLRELIDKVRVLMDERDKERDKALKLQAAIYEEKEKAKIERIKKLEEAGYVTRAFLWTVVMAILGAIYFILNYFKH